MENAASDTSINSPTRDWMIDSLGQVMEEPANQPRFIGVSSGIALARLVMAAIRVESPPRQSTPRHIPYQPVMNRTVAQASLPPRHAAEHLVDVYFQYRTPHFPIVERSKVNQAIQGVYVASDNQQTPDKDDSRDLFMAYMIFAIALCGVHHSSGDHQLQSEACFHSAILEIDNLFAYSRSDLETLRAILLLCQYITLCPAKGSLWLLTGLALRSAIDLGLHWETDRHKLGVDTNLMNDRRRLWYSTYLFDRLLCITLGRPFGINDGTNVELPSPFINADTSDVDVHARHAHNHIIRLAQLESEIKLVLYSNFRSPSLAFTRPNYTMWINDIQPRLQEWYTKIPSITQAHPSSIFASQAYWDAIFNNALLLLYRPNPIISQPSVEALRITFDASCKLISNIKVLHRERNIDIMWKWVSHLFMAGLTVLYGLWHPDMSRNLVVESNNSISTLQSCASTLSALAERWPGAAGCRDAFEALSSATVDWLVKTNTEEIRQSRLNFEKELQNLQQRMISPHASGDAAMSDDGPMAVLSTDGFGFGQFLNSAAQWPEYQEFDFNGQLDFDSAIRTDLELYLDWR